MRYGSCSYRTRMSSDCCGFKQWRIRGWGIVEGLSPFGFRVRTVVTSSALLRTMLCCREGRVLQISFKRKEMTRRPFSQGADSALTEWEDKTSGSGRT
jgi:hypothetical protein